MPDFNQLLSFIGSLVVPVGALISVIACLRRWGARQERLIGRIVRLEEDAARHQGEHMKDSRRTRQVLRRLEKSNTELATQLAVTRENNRNIEGWLKQLQRAAERDKACPEG